MRYGVVLLVGLIGGYLLAVLVPRPEKENKVFNEVSQQQVAEKQQSSPFTPVEEEVAPTVALNIEQEDSEPSVLSGAEQEATAAHPIEITNPDSIRHYADLADFFRKLGSANTEQLDQLAAKLRSRFQFNYSNQYYTTVAAAVYQRWAEVDFDAALDSLADIDSAQYGPDMGIYMSMLQVLAIERPELMQEWMETQNRQVRDMVQHTVYAGMAENDPESLARRALQLKGPDGEGMLYQALSEWARKDPLAAWQFTQENSDANTHPGATHTILQMWIDTDATTAMATLEGLIANGVTDAATAEGYTELYVSALARTDPQAALDYLSVQATPEQRYAGQGAFYEIARNHPDMLMDWLEQQPAEQWEELWSMAYMPLVEVKSMSDPQAAMALLDRIPQGLDPGMQYMILDQWIMQDSEGAVNWIQNLPDTSDNRQLMMQAVGTLMHSEPDPAAKLSLVERLVPVVDENTALQIAHTIGREDPQMARDWLSRNTDANTYALASVAIDANDSSIPTSQLLQQLDAAGSNTQPYLLMELLQTRMQDMEEISQWLETTGIFSNEDRQQLQMMFGISGDGAAPYIGVNPERFTPPFGQ